MSVQKTIKVDIVSDVACPWCYVGKRRIEAAIKAWEGSPIEIEWHPFQLDPTIPAEGIGYREYLINKFGSMERIQPSMDNLEKVGKELDINFDFASKKLSVNTLPLHQLMYVAGKEGRKAELKKRFLKAYFEDNVPLNDLKILVEIMSEFGWTKDKVQMVIEDQEVADKVKSEISFYQQRGVTGVPFFVINNKYGISGAQPVDVFLKAFESVSPILIDEGENCDLETGIC